LGKVLASLSEYLPSLWKVLILLIDDLTRPFSCNKTPKWKFDFAELEMENNFRKFSAILAVKV